jgi:hypothetical protein
MITMAMSVITLSLSMLTIMAASPPASPQPNWTRHAAP